MARHYSFATVHRGPTVFVEQTMIDWPAPQYATHGRHI